MSVTHGNLPPIYFLRHGETDWNHQRRIQGQIDTDLNETGRGQARRVAALLASAVPDPAPFRFVVSPMARARQTMAAVLSAYGLPDDHARPEERLKELNFGEMEGKSWHDLHARGIHPEVDPEFYHGWRPGGGESYADGRARVADWLAALDEPAIVVAHGGISRILRGIVFDLPPREIVQLRVPQDRFFRIQDGGLDWFDAREKAA